MKPGEGGSSFLGRECFLSRDIIEPGMCKALGSKRFLSSDKKSRGCPERREEGGGGFVIGRGVHLLSWDITEPSRGVPGDTGP